MIKVIKYIKSLKKLHLIFILSFHSLSFACVGELEPNFKLLYTNINKKEIKVHQIPTSLSKSNTIPKNLISNEDTDIFIGFEPNGHIYISTQKFRFDGHFFFRNNQRLKKTQLLNHGFIIKIKDKNNMSNQLIEAMKKIQDKRSFNCVTEACDVLNSLDHIKIQNFGVERTPLPSNFLNKILEQTDLEMDFYHLSQNRLNQDLSFLNNFYHALKEEYSDQIKTLKTTGLSLLGGSIASYYLWDYVFNNEK